MMDPKEVERLLRMIRDHGHDVRYDPRTRRELDERGIIGMGETVLGEMRVGVPKPDEIEESLCLCTVIAPGEMLTLPDNKTGPCAWTCGRTVQFRPWVTLPTVCLYCLAERPTKDQ